MVDRELRNGAFHAWHGHLAREKPAFSEKVTWEIARKMPVPPYLAISFWSQLIA